jgi:hypothetical protein
MCPLLFNFSLEVNVAAKSLKSTWLYGSASAQFFR